MTKEEIKNFMKVCSHDILLEEGKFEEVKESVLNIISKLFDERVSQKQMKFKDGVLKMASTKLERRKNAGYSYIAYDLTNKSLSSLIGSYFKF
jgi:hypothetical protein